MFAPEVAVIARENEQSVVQLLALLKRRVQLPHPVVDRRQATHLILNHLIRRTLARRRIPATRNRPRQRRLALESIRRVRRTLNLEIGVEILVAFRRLERPMHGLVSEV